MSDSEESDPEKRFEHLSGCPRCLREFWEEHIPLEEENSMLRAEVHRLRSDLESSQKALHDREDWIWGFLSCEKDGKVCLHRDGAWEVYLELTKKLYPEYTDQVESKMEFE